MKRNYLPEEQMYVSTNSIFKKYGRWLFALIIGTSLLWVAQPVQSQTDFTILFDKMAPAVVLIESTTVGTGSGFVVEYKNADDEIDWGIVTACHVVLQSPRDINNAQASTVFVTFKAWAPQVRMEAAVVKCDAATDSALLLPINDERDVVGLPEFFNTLAETHSDFSLRSFPRVWMGDSSLLGPLDSVFVLGYPGPFSEFSASIGRLSGRLPILYATTEQGSVDRLESLVIYTGGSRDTIGLDEILQIQQAPAIKLNALPELVNNVLGAGHSLMFLAGSEPLRNQVVGWDVVGIDEETGLVQVQERPVEIDLGLFGSGITIGPRMERSGAINFERTFLKLDAPIGGGNSGGPIFNISGQVVGIVEWGVDGLPGANFAGTAEEIQQMLFQSN